MTEPAAAEPLIEFPQYIDSSMRSTFISCPKRFYWEYILKLSPSTTSPDLHAGACFASAIERTRVEYYEAGAPINEAIERGFEHLTREWGDYEPPDRHDGSTHNKSFINTASAFIKYWEEYNPIFDRLRPYVNTDGSIATEYSFAIPTEIRHPTSGDPIIYCGRFDMLGYFEGAPDNLYIVDEKTTGSLGSTWAQKWGMRGQFLGYAYGAKQHGFRVQGAVIRGVAIMKTNTKFAQAVLSISNWQVERWWQQLQLDIQNMVDCWHMEGHDISFPYAYGEACEQYGGCSYMELCTARDPELWFGDYERRVWNPMQRNPTKETE
jgi:hypothetical protein